MADDKFKILEERLTRLEAVLSQQPTATAGGFTAPGGVVSDPAPWPGGYTFHPRWPPRIVSDPAPWPPHIVSDPAPWPPNIVSDPAPNQNVLTNQFQAQAVSARALGRIGPLGGDPPPPDLGRLSASQLEATLHSINAEKSRLDSMASLVQRHLDRANVAEKKNG